MRLRTIAETQGEETFASIDELQSYLEQKYDLDELWLTEGHKHIEVHNMRVKAGERDRGTGAEVIQAIQRYATRIGKRVVLSAEPDRGKKAALSRFYSREGFKKPGRKKDFSLPRHTHIWHPDE